MVGLDKARRRQLKEYSKGMTRRIGLAQALINDPELILLDEPTSGLDPLGSRDMKDLILKLKAQGKTIVMCSHLLADVQDVCDRIAILYQGEFVKCWIALTISYAIRTSPRFVPRSRLRKRSKKSKRSLPGMGEIHEIGQPTNTLEELFLKVIRESAERPAAFREHERELVGRYLEEFARVSD